MTGLKICGLTRESDVVAAVRCGAAACGFILSPSKRQITAARARELAEFAGGTFTVAVVTTESAAWIAERLDESELDAVQLSAGADGASVTDVRAAAARRGLRPRVIAAADTPDAGDADYVLLDARTPGVYGGTGTTLDWEALAAGDLPPRARLILAGGITPANAARAVATVAPGLLDVSSGIESAPGIKDHALLEALFAQVALADQRSGATP